MKCPTQGKTCHESKSAAFRHINNIVRRQHRKQYGTAYKCRDCGFFHITRSASKKPPMKGGFVRSFEEED